MGASHLFAHFLKHDPVERGRYETLKQTLQGLRLLFEGKFVLDYGASYGLSICALLELGAARVAGVEPDLGRVARCGLAIKDLGLHDRASIVGTDYGGRLPFTNDLFEVVLANAVLEHIPQPRDIYIKELWRVLAPGGYLIINESPNKYFPIDKHTTKLWFVPWLPRVAARRYAITRGRFRPDKDWNTSGWRGIGYYEVARALRQPFRLLPERSRLRHRIFSRLGLPASIIDPYPTWIFEKL